MKEDKVILTLVKLRRKIWVNKIINCVVYSILISTMIVFLISIASHFVPIVNIFQKTILVIVLGFIFGIVYGFIKIPTMGETAVIGDELGFGERFSTYIEYKDESNRVLDVFFKEVEKMVCDKDVIKKYHIKINKKVFILSLIVLLVSVAISFIPSNNRDIAREKEDIRKDIESEEIEKIKELKEYIEEEGENGNVGRKEMEEILDRLEELEKKLAKTYDYNEAAFSVLEAEKELNKILDKYDNSNLPVEDIFNSGDSQIVSNTQKNDSMNNTLSSSHEEKEYENMDDIESETGTNTNGAKNISSPTKNAQMDLESMKQRLLSKNQGGFESIGGNDKTDSFTKGENSNFESGEASDDGFEDLIEGQGTGSDDEGNGVGGSGKGDEFSSSFRKDGEIEKSDESTKYDHDKSQTLNIKGEKTEKGKMKTDYSDKGLGTKGMNKLLSSSLRDFDKDRLDYIKKFNVPESSKRLVITYFESLMEVN